LKHFLIELPPSHGGDGGTFLVTCGSAGCVLTESVENRVSKDAATEDIAAFGTLPSALGRDGPPSLPRRGPPHMAVRALSGSPTSAACKEG